MGIRHRNLLLILLAIFCLLASADAQQWKLRRVTGPRYREGEIVVGYERTRMTTAGAKVQADFGAQPARTLPRLNAQIMRSAKATRDIHAFCRAVRKIPGVRFCEPNYMRRAQLAAPNDPAYNTIDTVTAPFLYDEEGTATYYQWTLRQIEALAGWNIFPNAYYTSATRPAGAIKVAVIDTGIDIDNVDFMNAGGASTTVASGGQIDAADGYNVQTGDTDYDDDFGHGTAVSGVIGAATNNGGGAGGQGIAGLAYHAQIMPVKALDAAGSGTESDIANGITWAVDHGAVVINISAGDYDYSQLEQDAIDYAWENGTIVIAAAGNDGDTTRLYPAACAGVLAVAATIWPDDSPASYSNNGDFVGISAPAGDVSLVPLGFWLTWSLMPNTYVPMHEAGWEPGFQPYQYQAGTSLACPHAAGLAALYASNFGITQATPNGVQRIFQALQRGSDNVGAVAGWNPYWGWGRINVEQTLLDASNRGATVGRITGQLRDLDGAPVALKSVKAKAAGTETIVGSATTRADGTFYISGLAPGDYDVTSTVTPNTATVQDVPVVASADTPHTILDLGPVANDPPSVPTSVTVSPTSPTGADDLTAAASGGIDPEDQPVTYECKWEKSTNGGGSWTAGPIGETLPASQTARDEMWRAQARSSDGVNFSAWVISSNTVTIGNAAPVVTAIRVQPANPNVTTELAGIVDSSSDPDGDTFTYRWAWETSPDGTDWTAGPTGRFVGVELLTQGDHWRVRCRAYDGTAYSDWLTSDEVIIGNAAPSPPTWAKIKPLNPNTATDLTASAGGGNDPDGDTVTYRYQWYSSPDGTTWLKTGYMGRVLSAAATTLGQHWKVGVRSHDGQKASALFFSAEVIIGNAPPSKPTLVTISPASPGDSNNLTATASGSVDPEGGTVTYKYRWYSSPDGTTWTAESYGRTLSNLSTTPGEQWRCGARASDGTATSAMTYSAPVTIGGAAAAAPLKASALATWCRSRLLTPLAQWFGI